MTLGCIKRDLVTTRDPPNPPRDAADMHPKMEVAFGPGGAGMPGERGRRRQRQGAVAIGAGNSSATRLGSPNRDLKLALAPHDYSVRPITCPSGSAINPSWALPSGLKRGMITEPPRATALSIVAVTSATRT